MYEATLLKMYLVDKNNNLASKVVSNISKMMNKHANIQKEQKTQSVSFNTKYINST
tara:strand:- start:5465 stop:5632 length:168 start_codon:yes stop_codon:yes gene_type:complete